MNGTSLGTITFVGSFEEDSLGDSVLKVYVVDLLEVFGKVVVYETSIVLFVTTSHNMRADNEFLAFVNLFVGIEILGNVCLCEDLSFGVLFVESILT